MKKIIVALLLVSSTLVFSLTEIDVNRNNLWGKVSISGNFSNTNYGFLGKFGSRYNLTYLKESNGTEVDDRTIDAWLQELWLGFTYSKSLKKNLKYCAKLLYRPRFFYIDEVGAPSYQMHTFSNHNNLTYKLDKSSNLNYRMILWYQLPYDIENAEYDAEFYNRHLIGITRKITPKFSLEFAEEILLNVTADDENGQEFFEKNLIYLGGTYKLSKQMGVKLFYINVFTNKLKDDVKEIDVKDNYLEFTLFYKF